MDFKSDLANISMDKKLDLHHLVEVYNQKCADILYKHAPLKSKTLKITHIQPWFNDKIKMEILLRRRLEWRWLQVPTQYNLQSFYYQRRHVGNVIKTAPKHHYNEKIAESSHDPKALFRIFNTILRRNDPLPLPPTTCDKTLANDFSNFFVEKIDKIMSFLRSSEPEPDSSEYFKTNYTKKQRTTKFELTTTTAVTELIKKSQAKMCVLDPMSSSLVKEYAAILAPIITQIINKSIDEGTVSENLKNAILKSLLKQQGLALTFGNYHLVSNLLYILKLLEKVVSTQLIDLAETLGYMEPYQSTYHSGHSTATAVLWVKTDILCAYDNKEITCVVLLDLSAAFNTICHETLPNCLKFKFGLGETF